MNTTIRRATIEDLSEIQTLNNELFKYEFTNFDDSLKVGWPFEAVGEKYFKDMITNNYVIVALADDKIIGYLAGTIKASTSYNLGDKAELENMFISEKYRKAGIGSSLIQNFIQYCHDNQIEDIRVTASFKNNNAINFYRKNGFEDFELTLRLK